MVRWPENLSWKPRISIELSGLRDTHLRCNIKASLIYIMLWHCRVIGQSINHCLVILRGREGGWGWGWGLGWGIFQRSFLVSGILLVQRHTTQNQSSAFSLRYEHHIRCYWQVCNTASSPVPLFKNGLDAVCTVVVRRLHASDLGFQSCG